MFQGFALLDELASIDQQGRSQLSFLFQVPLPSKPPPPARTWWLLKKLAVTSHARTSVPGLC